jgi:flagellar motor switch protein FliG
MNATTDYSQLTGSQKAAILMTVLGDETAATIFRNLPEEDLQRVTREISSLGRVAPKISQQVIQEYHKMTAGRDYLAEGGHATANRLLVKAFGESGAKSLQHQLVRVEELSAGRAESLHKADPKQLARLLEGEHPQTLALVLGHLEPKQASALLMHLPRGARAESVRRLANLRQFSPVIAERISTAVHRRLRSAGEINKRTYSGFENVAALMNSVDPETSREILENIEGQDAKLATNIRELMFTFEDFLRVDDVQLRELSGAVDKKVLAVALKGTTAELRDHFFRTMSTRAVEMLKEDIDSLGQVRGKEVSKAHGEMVALARKLEEEGKMVLRNDGGDAYV